MNAHTEQRWVSGPAGRLECAVDPPAAAPMAPALAGGLAVVCHPHPLHGGTMGNKVVQTLARAFVQLGLTAVRFNFRGVGASEGAWDAGRGELDDARAVVAAWRQPGQPLVLAGFSFGAYVASQVAADSGGAGRPTWTVLVGPAVANFPVAPVAEGALVIHGEADDVVLLPSVLDWARPQAQPVTVVPGAGHFFHGQLALLKRLVIDGGRAFLPASSH
ncbi:MAG: alpha/beta hydrolase [Rubrivivax sp.]